MISMAINWKNFENNNFVSFEENKAKKLVLSGWREDVAKFDGSPAKPAIVFDVLSEDGVACDPKKTLTASNHTLVMGLRPFIEAADAAGVGQVVLNIGKSGQGKGTKYMVLQA